LRTRRKIAFFKSVFKRRRAGYDKKQSIKISLFVMERQRALWEVGTSTLNINYV